MVNKLCSNSIVNLRIVNSLVHGWPAMVSTILYFPPIQAGRSDISSLNTLYHFNRPTYIYRTTYYVLSGRFANNRMAGASPPEKLET